MSNSRKNGRKGSSKKDQQRRDPKPKQPKDAAQEYEQGKQAEGRNDVEWWTPSDTLVRNVASIPTGRPIGKPIELPADGIYTKFEYDAPGIMALHYVPTVGAAGTLSDPFNIAIQELEVAVRKTNTGSGPYDPANVGLAFMAFTGAISFHTWMTRLYALLQKYYFTNTYFPYAFFEAEGVDYDDLKANMANFRAYINLYANRISKFPVPKGMQYVQRMMQLNSNIYSDRDSAKAQMYIYVPDAFYKYNEPGQSATSRVGTVTLEWKRDHMLYGGTKMNFEDIRDLGDMIADSITNSQDLSVIRADIIKAFSPNLVSVGEISESVDVPVQHNAEVLSQIHNTKVLTYQGDKVTFPADFGKLSEVVEGYAAGAIQANLDYISNRPCVAYSTILDFFVDEPSPKDVMIATRDIPFVSSELVQNKWHNTIVGCGTEVVIYAQILTATSTGTDVYSFSTLEHKDYTTQLVAKLQPFDMHPMVTIASSFETKPVPITHMIGDVYNYTIGYKEDILEMHRVALLGALRIPTSNLMK